MCIAWMPEFRGHPTRGFRPEALVSTDGEGLFCCSAIKPTLAHVRGQRIARAASARGVFPDNAALEQIVDVA
jgi:hypothetical protein